MITEYNFVIQANKNTHHITLKARSLAEAVEKLLKKFKKFTLLKY